MLRNYAPRGSFWLSVVFALILMQPAFGAHSARQFLESIEIMAVSTEFSGCPGTEIQVSGLLVNSNCGTYTIEWSSNQDPNLEFLSAGNILNPMVEIQLSPLKYWVKITELCTGNADSIRLTFNPSITADAGPNKGLCTNQTDTIGTVGFPGLSYSWTPASGLSNAQVARPQISYPGIINNQVYTLTVSNNLGCQVSDSVKVNYRPVPVPDFSADTVCAGSGTHFSNITPSPNSISSWSWSFGVPGGASNVFSPTFAYSQPNRYTVTLTATGNNGCQASKTRNIEVASTPQINGYVKNDPNDCNSNDGRISISASASYIVSPGLQYSIDGGNTWRFSTTFNSLPAGTYHLKVKNGHSCIADGPTVTLTDPPMPSIVAVDKINPSDCNQTNGRITITAIGGTGSFLYSINGIDWVPGNVFNNLGAGSYPVLVRNSNGTCRVSYGLVVLSQPQAPIITFVNPKNPTNCGSSDGSIIINSAGGTQPHQFSINGGNSWSSTNNFQSLPKGVYNIMVRNSNTTCPVTGGGVELKDPKAPSLVEFITQNPSDCDASNGSIELDANPGATPIQYSIDGGQSWADNNIFQNLPENTYSVFLRNNNGTCRINAGTVQITDPAAPAISQTTFSNPTDCGSKDGIITITASAGIGLFQFSIDNGNSWHPNGLFSNLDGGNFHAMVRNGDGTCPSAAQSILLESPKAPTHASFSANDPSTCHANDGEILLNANSPLGVQFSINGGTNWHSSGVFNNLSNGNYPILYRNADTTCETRLATLDLVAPASIQIDTVITTNVTDCGKKDGSISIVASYPGVVPLDFSIDNGATWSDTSWFADLQGGNYQVRVRATDGSCEIGYPAMAIDAPVQPVVMGVVTADPTDCFQNNGKIYFIKNENDAFEISIDGGLSYSNNHYFKNLDPGVFSLKVRNPDGTCVTDLGSKSLSLPSAPVVTEVETIQPSACNTMDGEIHITAQGSGNLHFSIDGGLSWQNQRIFKNLGSGDYQVMVRNSNGSCSQYGSLAILRGGNPDLEVSALAIPADCSSRTGGIRIEVRGNQDVMKFSIDGGTTWQSESLFENLFPGTYHYLVQEGKDCITNGGFVTVPEQNVPVFTDFTKTNPSHCASTDGSIAIHASGSMGTIQYSVNGGLNWQNSNHFTGLGSGRYQIMIRYANGSCPVGGDEVMLQASGSPLVLTTKSQLPTCNGNDGMVEIIAGSSTGNALEYSLDGGQSWQVNARFENLTNGVYEIGVRNSNQSCPIVGGLVRLTPTKTPVITDILPVAPDCYADNGAIEIQLQSQMYGLTEYTINNGQSWKHLSSFEQLPPGNYEVKARNMATGQWCYSDMQPVNLVRPQTPIVAFSMANPTDCDANNGRITVNARGNQTMEYSLDTSTWQSSNVFGGLSAGTYTAYVRYVGGACMTNSSPVALSAPISPVIEQVTSQNPNCNGLDGYIGVEASGGTGDLEYSFDGGQSWQTDNLLQTLQAGDYHIMVRNANGSCVVDGGTVPISQKKAPVITAVIPQVPSCDASDGSIRIEASITDGPASLLEFSINQGNSWQASSQFEGLDAGTFQIQVRRTDDACLINHGNFILAPPETPEILVVSTQQPTTCDSKDGVVEILALGPGGLPGQGLEYSLDQGITWSPNPVFSNLSAATYTPMARFDNGTCAISDNPITLVAPRAPSRSSLTVKNPDCDKTNGRIDVRAFGSGQTVQYSIDGGQNWSTNGVFSNLTAGNYTLVYRYNDLTCTTVDTIVPLVYVNQIQLSQLNVEPPSACDAADGTIVPIVQGAYPLQYQLNNGPWVNNSVFTSLAPGTYQVSVRYADGSCVQDFPARDLVATHQLEIADVNTTFLSTCNATDGTITIESRANGSVEYSLNGVNWQDNPVFENLGAGTYTPHARLKDFNCTKTGSPVAIQTADPFEISEVTLLHSSDCGADNGQIEIIVHAANMLAYSINDGATWTLDNSFENLAPGNYMVWARTFDGSCEVEYSGNPVAIQEPAVPSLDVVQTNPDCYRNNGIIEAESIASSNPFNRPIQYRINNGPWQASGLFENLATGTYTIESRLQNTTCIAGSSLTLTEPADCPDCDPVFTADTISLDETTMLNPVCIPMPLNATLDYQLILDGQTIQHLGGCDADSIYYYGYVPLITLGGTDGPFRLDFWEFNGTNYRSFFQTFDELVDSMNVWDDTGNWVHDPNTFSISGGRTGLQYGNLKITHIRTSRNVTLMSNRVPVFNGIQITIADAGWHQLIAQHNNGICTDTLAIYIDPAPAPTQVEIYQRILSGENFEICDWTDYLGSNPGSISVLSNPSIGAVAAPSGLCSRYESGQGSVGRTTYSLLACTQNGNMTICDTIQVHVTIEPPKDTLFLMILPDTPLDTCLDNHILQLPGGNYQVSSCGNINAGFVASPGNSRCLTITPGIGFAGTSRLCVIHCDDQPLPWGPLCDTTIMELVVAEPCANPVFPEDTIFVSSINGFGNVCLPIPLFQANQYQYTVDGQIYTNGFTDCQVDSVNSYSYFQLPGNGMTGPFRVDNWRINGLPYTGVFANIRELVAQMNSWDPSGNWELYESIFTIIGSANANQYSNIVLTQTTLNTTFTLTLSEGEFTRGSEFPLQGTGLHTILAQHRASGCVDMAFIVLEDQPLPQTDTVRFVLNENELLENQCINHDELQGDLVNFSICQAPANGSLILDGFHCLDYIPQIDFSGIDTACVVICDAFGVCDTTILIFEVQPDLSCDPIFVDDQLDVVTDFCNGMGSVCLPIDPISFNDYQFYIDGRLYTGNRAGCNFDTLLAYNMALLPGGLQTGSFRLTSWSYNGQVFSTDFGSVQELADSMNVWDPNGNWRYDPGSFLIEGGLLNIVYGNLNILQLNSGTNTIIAPQFEYIPHGTAINMGIGIHQVIGLHVPDGCRDTLRVDLRCPEMDDLVVDSTLRVGQSLVICLSDLDINFDENYISSIVNNCTNHQNAQFQLDMLSNCLTITGLSPGQDSVCYEICLQNGDCFTWLVRVDVFQPCQDFIGPENLVAPVNCGASSLDLCVTGFSVPAVSSNFSLLLDGFPYGDPLQPCNFDSIFSFSYFSLPGQGNSGPYRIISWRINSTIFSGEFDDVPGLLDSMNTWDPTGNWTLNLAGLSIIGGNPRNSYGIMNVVQIATNSPATLVANTTIVPRGISISVSQPGSYELVFIQNANDCRDTITVVTSCVESETILDTLLVNTSTTFCVSTSELGGNFASLTNVCEDESGELVVFDWSPGDSCITYTGIEPGTEQACFVLCNDLGVCDTTFLIVTVEALPDTTPIVANPDIFETGKDRGTIINVLGNDQYGPNLDTMFVSSPPTHGTAFFLPDGTLQYIPDPDYCDEQTPDSFEYTICNDNSCSTTQVLVTVRCELFHIYNAFSPNNDNINDNFVIDGIQLLPNNYLRVYNRWGNLVFETENYQNNWQGTWDGIDLPDGTYYYLFDDGAGKLHTGYVQIQR